MAGLLPDDCSLWSKCRTRSEHLAGSDTCFRILQIQALKREHKLRPFSQEDIDRDLRNVIIDSNRLSHLPVVRTRALGLIPDFTWRKSDKEDRVGKDYAITFSTFV